MSLHREIVRRYEGNPILTREDVPYPVETVHNAGVTRHGDRYVMLFRAHRRNGRSIIGIAESGDGYRFRVRPAPWLTPAESGPFAEYEEYGVEDPRICSFEDVHLVTYSAYSRHGVRIGLVRTPDFESIERVAMITPCDTRNVVIFPARFGGRYARLERPHTEISPWSVWISYSPDLVHWGDARVVMKPLPYHWDEMKIGPGATPIRTKAGWLHVYHGVFRTMDGAVYRLGVALHDLEDPARVLGVADDWILEPQAPWERTGYVHNVVFTCGAVAEEDGTLKLYWGGADTVVCVGTASVDELVALCLEKPRPPL
ncbi:MAG TPA: glycoside hydrolase family 130 protein [Longimicrobiales bacterium]|nr:glycoside hydrolase family 130 protein [Longimicrobiales bacterium]